MIGGQARCVKPRVKVPRILKIWLYNFLITVGDVQILYPSMIFVSLTKQTTKNYVREYICRNSLPYKILLHLFTRVWVY